MSVVIPTWNRESLLPRAVQSVLEQTFEDFELIVVDDGSTDGTLGFLESVADPRLRVISCPHRGRGAARNAGVAAASGNLLTFLDSDDVAEPTWLQELVTAFERGGTDVVLSGLHFVEPDGSLTARIPDRARGADADTVSPVFLPGCWILRRTDLIDCGGFDPEIRYGENTEVALRLYSRRPNLRVQILPRALIRMTRRTAPLDRTGQVLGAMAVLRRYRHFRHLFPKTWASCSTIVGVDRAQRGDLRQARKHLVEGLRSDPSPRRALRLAAACLPPVARRVWHTEDEPPGVLFVALAPGVGGSVRSLATVLAGLAGVNRLVAGPAASSTARFIDERGLADTYIELPPQGRSRAVNRVRVTVRLARLARYRRHGLTAIHANGLAELNLALLPALLSRRRIVVWVHEWAVPPWSRRMSPVLRLASRWISYAAVSDQSLGMLRASGLVTVGQGTVVPNPIDPSDVRGEMSSAANGLLRVGYLGSPARYKGFHLLPEVVRLTRGSGVGWTIFAGPETTMPETFRELRSLGATIKGKVADVRAAYGTLDAVLVPSLEESFGRVAAEAMANGLPVVASDLPALRAVLGDGEAGLLVERGDAAGLAAAVLRLADDPALRDRLGRRGSELSERFLPGPIVQALASMYGLAAS